MPIEEMVQRVLQEQSRRAVAREAMRTLPMEMQELYEHADPYTRRWQEDLMRIAAKEATALPPLPWETMFRELSLQAIPVAQKLSDNKKPGPKKTITAHEEFLIETVTIFLNGEHEAAMARLHEAFGRDGNARGRTLSPFPTEAGQIGGRTDGAAGWIHCCHRIRSTD
jgi:hypothetical protein